MRALAHVCAIALLIPQVLAATAFAILDHVTSGHTIGAFFKNVFEVLDLFFGWRGLVLVAAVLVVLGAGFSDRWRTVAAWCVIVAAIGSAVLLLVHIGPPPSFDGYMFFLPGVISMALAYVVMRRASTISSREPL